MDWLTQSEIQKAAETSLLAAVRCSKKHWWQLATATGCPLSKPSACAGNLWGYAADKTNEWRAGDAPHSDFTLAARALHKRLCAEERKLKG
jgi:hypothetical protein